MMKLISHRSWILFILVFILAPSLKAQHNCADATVITTIPYSHNNQPVFGFGDDIDCGEYAGEDYFFKYTASTGICVNVHVSFTAPFVGSFLCVLVSEDCPYLSEGEIIGYAQYANIGSPFSGFVDINHLQFFEDSTYFIAVQLVGTNSLPKFSISITESTCPPPCPVNIDPENNSSPLTVNSLSWEALGADSFHVFYGTTPDPYFVESTTDSTYVIPPLTDTMVRYWRIQPFMDDIPNPNCGVNTFQLQNQDSDAFPDYLDLCPLDFSINNYNSDNDALGDACDDDDDNDGLPDTEDNCPTVHNPLQEDSDSDGTGDACEIDYDNDGIPNLEDNCISTPNPPQQDTDGDGWGNACDNCPLTFNPDQTNYDDDQWGDVCDNCPFNPGPQDDNDNDGLGDLCDPCLSDPTNADGDNCADLFDDPYPDGIPDQCDNCPNACNPNQADFDGDGIGDACDEDADNDGVPDFFNDNCFLLYNPNQANQDGDFYGDLCDNCPSIANNNQFDSDNDGIGNACDLDPENDGFNNDVDNCPTLYNPGQEDADNDGRGDACDNCDFTANPGQSDMDGDLLGDACDNCPSLYNSDQEDTDNDGAGNVCEFDDDNDGIADANDNCFIIFNPSQSDQDLDGWGDACDNCPLSANISQQDDDLDGVGNACDTLLPPPIPQRIGINTTLPAAALHVAGGHIFLDDPQGRIIFKHVNGECYRIKITPSLSFPYTATMSLETITCPISE